MILFCCDGNTATTSRHQRRQMCGGFETVSSRSRVRHSTAEPLRLHVSIPLGPISIPVAVGPYQKWTEGTPFIFKETVEVDLPSLASNVEESTICLHRCDLFLAS